MNARRFETVEQGLEDLVVAYVLGEGVGPCADLSIWYPTPGAVPAMYGVLWDDHAIVDPAPVGVSIL